MVILKCLHFSMMTMIKWSKVSIFSCSFDILMILSLFIKFKYDKIKRRKILSSRQIQKDSSE